MKGRKQRKECKKCSRKAKKFLKRKKERKKKKICIWIVKENKKSEAITEEKEIRMGKWNL